MGFSNINLKKGGKGEAGISIKKKKKGIDWVPKKGRGKKKDHRGGLGRVRRMKK